ncbi:MAG: GntR family transcriptional regulator [Lachnospiraceae bacterium]|nr:GntR family transcriptional regulator [Lachnospiraceae bacterium]
MQISERRPNESGRDYAMRILKDNIINLELEPGMAISDRDLAAQMGLSRTPVREALLDLAKVKIVEIYPQRGSVIAKIDYSLAEEAQFVRYVLEVAVVELVCSCVDDSGIQALEENVGLQEFYLAHPQPAKMLELDNQFHRLLFQIAGKNQAYEMMNSLTIHFDRIRRMAVLAVKEQKWMEDHRQILEAVKKGDVRLARQCMDRHLNRFHVDEAAIRQQYPQYFIDR